MYQKPKILSIEVNWNFFFFFFLGGGGGGQTKNLFGGGGGMDIFWNNTIQKINPWSRARASDMDGMHAP